MQRSSYSQAGFGIIGFVAVAAILGLIIFLGWNMWQKSSSTNQADQSTQTNTPLDADKPERAYLKVKEWDVQLPLDEGMEKTYYESPGTGVGGLGESIGIYDKDFDNITNSLGRSCAESQVGSREASLLAISRINTSDAPKIQQIDDEFDRNFFANQLKKGKTIGNYTYFVTSMHQSYPFCVFVDEENTKQDQSIIKTWEDKKTALNEAFEQIAQ